MEEEGLDELSTISGAHRSHRSRAYRDEAHEVSVWTLDAPPSPLTALSIQILPRGLHPNSRISRLSWHRQRNPEKHLLHEYVHILKHIAGRPTEFLNVRMLFLIRSCLLPSFLCRRVGGSRPVRHTRAVPVDGRHHPGLFSCISRSLYRQ